MGNNYNIKRNVPEPDTADINKFKDFDALLASYQNTESTQEGGKILAFISPREGQSNSRMRRWILMGSSLATAAAVALLLIVRSLDDLPTPAQSLAVADAYFAQKPFVNPPLAKVKTQGKKISVDVALGASVELNEGTRLVIPRTAFQNDRGQLIQAGEVDVFYREMHDAVDFFLAGVPMTYDSAGMRHYLQSAGMIEIIAIQNGHPVGMAPGKKIRIELQSNVVPQADGSWPTFKVYHLDTLERNWVFRGSSSMVFDEAAQVEPIMNAEQEYEAKKSAILAADPAPLPPAKPVKPDGKAISFNMDLRSGEIPVEPGSEEAVASLQKGSIWQVLPNCPSFDPALLNLEWKSAGLKRLSEVEYELTLIDDNQQLRLLVQPVIIGKEFENAVKRYEEVLARHQLELSEWEKRSRKNLKALEEAYKIETDNQEGKSTFSNSRKVRHIFDINAFGIWNCDRPAPLASSSFRIRTIEDQNGNKYPNQTAYLTDKSGGSVYQLHTGRGSTVYFDTKKEYLLWLMTPEGKLAMVKTQAEWADSNPKKGVNLNVKIFDREIRNETDLRKALKSN
jgi:hypothetical protein